ncbi:hypothetical protein B0H14DRAFT_3713696, partial [Mycena olivaceomarginata]
SIQTKAPWKPPWKLNLPALVFNLWRDGSRWPKAQKYLREMTIPCAHELALQDSNRIIASPHLRVRLKTLTIWQLRELLHPTKLIEIIKELAPFTCGILYTFSTTPNKARRQRKTEEDVPMPPTSTGVEEDWAENPNDDENIRQVVQKPYKPLAVSRGFLAFHMVEDLKVRIMDDAIRLAVELITSDQVFFTIFDNSNIFLRKSQIFTATVHHPWIGDGGPHSAAWGFSIPTTSISPRVRYSLNTIMVHAPEAVHAASLTPWLFATTRDQVCRILPSSGMLILHLHRTARCGGVRSIVHAGFAPHAAAYAVPTDGALAPWWAEKRMHGATLYYGERWAGERSGNPDC